MLTTTLPSQPWERIASGRQNYLVVVDYFSCYIELTHFKNMSRETTFANLQNICARWGCPNHLVTDNGPQSSGRIFEQFVKDYDIKYITTSLHYPQANGETERALQTAKRISGPEDLQSHFHSSSCRKPSLTYARETDQKHDTGVGNKVAALMAGATAHQIN